MNQEIINQMSLARNAIIAFDLRNFKPKTTSIELIEALEAQAGLYDANVLDGRKEGWKNIKHLANHANLAYLASRADRADLAYRADRADLAYRAYLADLAYLVAFSIKTLGPLIEVKPNLDSLVLASIEKEGNGHDQESWGDICDTTHCRGGWAVMTQTYAAELVGVFGWAFSASMIYQASTGAIPNFFDMNSEKVLAEIKMAATSIPVSAE